MSKLSFLYISKKNDKMIGKIASGNEFSTSLVLGDLMYNIDKQIENSVFAEKVFENIFGISLFEYENDSIKYTNAITQLKEMVVDNKYLSMSDFDKIKIYHEITFNVLISKNHYETIVDKTISSEESFYYLDNNFETFFDTQYENEHMYCYNFHSAQDIIFAIMHYLISFDYKFQKCRHCGKYFATQNLKNKYCERYSPIKRYSHLQCFSAQHSICQHLNSIYKKVYAKHVGNKNLDIGILNDFQLLFGDCNISDKSYQNLEQFLTEIEAYVTTKYDTIKCYVK